MNFVSTRKNSKAVTISEAMRLGLAPDGGLYLPETFPAFDLQSFLPGERYAETAFRFLEPFFKGDPLAPHLRKICDHAFSFPIVVKDVGKFTSVLELFHGPTAAFKDVGARFLAECMAHSPTEPQTILVATSGDTGGAVAAAFFKRPGFKVVILYPKDGVSPRQQKQLTAWGQNIQALAIDGSFDDCQKLVKTAFSDAELRKRKNLSSANSINIGRILPQCTYYAYASLLHERKYAEPASFIIPSGNLGNAMAALWVKTMGFPIDQIGIATNANKVIPNYFSSNTWAPGETRSTIANAMDVGNPSNMERFFTLEKESQNLKQSLFAGSVSDQEIEAEIRRGEAEFGEIWCPHTATAVHLRREQDPQKSFIVVATAHPAKFEATVEPLIGHPVEIPKPLATLIQGESHFKVLSTSYDKFKKELI